MMAFINPGPRHAATRAAMNAGVGRTEPAHILPIALTVLSGDHLGGQEVENAMRYLRAHVQTDPQEIADDLLTMERPPAEGDWHIMPGFGCRFGGIDPIPQLVAEICRQQPASGAALKWGSNVASLLKPKNMGWLTTGVAAAVFCDLGFHSRAGAGLFQIMSAPGLLAHGLEMANKPITAMPFLDEEHYVIENGAKKPKN